MVLGEWAEHKRKCFPDRFEATCAKCTLLDAPGPCWGVGSTRDAKLIYIAQNPGRDEVNARPMQPLIGASGRVFNHQLFEAGIRRSELYITNVCKCFTEGNRTPTSHEIACCAPHLEVELERCKADVVLLAGEVAFNSQLANYSTIDPAYHPTTGKGKKIKPAGIMTRMGCVEYKDGRKWIGTIHPAFIMRMPQWKDAALDHLRKAWQLVGAKQPSFHFNLTPSSKEILEYVHHIKNKVGEFAYDVETVGLEEVDEDDYCGADYKVTMCGFGGDDGNVLVCSPEQISLLTTILDDNSLWRYAHNGQYDDYHVQKYIRANFSDKSFDTMLGTHYLRSYAPKKLKPYVLSQYTSLPYYNRDLGNLDKRLYNCMDVVTTYLAAQRIKEELQSNGLWDLYFRTGQPLLPILEDMRVVGVNTDLRKLFLFREVTEQKIVKAELMLAHLMPGVNPNADQQVMALLYDTWKLPAQTHPSSTDRNKIIRTIDFEARKHLRWWVEKHNYQDTEPFSFGYQALQLLDFLNGEQKKLEYLDRVSADGRMHPFFKAHGTVFFRLSSTPNLQNFPVYDISNWGGARRDDGASSPAPVDIGDEVQKAGGYGSLRSLIIPDDPDRDVFLTIDVSMLQLAMYAAQWGAKWLLDVYSRGEYVYGVIYEELFKEPFFKEGLPKTKANKRKDVVEQRIRRAKAVPLGFTKGRSIKAVADEQGWSIAEATALNKWWLSKVPEFAQGENTVRYQLQQHRKLKLAFGQIVHFPSGKVTDALDAVGQANEAIFMCETMVLINNKLKELNLPHTRIALQCHDSLTFNVPEEHCVTLFEAVASVFGRPIKEMNNLQLGFSAEVSKEWDWNTTNYYDWKCSRATV